MRAVSTGSSTLGHPWPASKKRQRKSITSTITITRTIHKIQLLILVPFAGVPRTKKGMDSATSLRSAQNDGIGSEFISEVDVSMDT